MSQARLRDYQEPILSFDHNLFNLGLHNPGRYCGFDTLEVLSSVTANIKHTQTGFSYKDQINTTKGPCGVIMTPQGILVMEDDLIGPLTFDSNAGNTSRRFDLIVCNHQHIVTAGGAAATYSVIKGTIGSEIKPILPTPLLQTAVATIEFAPNGDLTTAIIHKMKCPDSGDGEDARLTVPNAFKAIQLFSASGTVYSAPTTTLTTGSTQCRLWQFNPDGNLIKIDSSATTTTLEGIKIKDVPLQEGTEITLLITQTMTLTENYFFTAGPEYAAGYRPLKINPDLGNMQVPSAGGGIRGIRPPVGQRWAVKLIFYNNTWFVMSISGANTNSAFVPGTTMMWYGSIIFNFDSTGLGMNLMSGWAICNGNNGTPDMRGKIPVMAAVIPDFSAGAPDLTDDSTITAAGLDPKDYILSTPYITQGKREAALVQANLPNCNMQVNDPGHGHGNFYRLDFVSGRTPSLADSTSSSRTGFFPNGVYAQNAPTGITVTTGGSDSPVSRIPPVYAHLFIMKI